MLVLLIIFMVAAPLATVDIQVDLAGLDRAAATTARMARCLTVKADLTYLGNDTVNRELLGSTLNVATKGDGKPASFCARTRRFPTAR